MPVFVDELGRFEAYYVPEIKSWFVELEGGEGKYVKMSDEEFHQHDYTFAGRA